MDVTLGITVATLPNGLKIGMFPYGRNAPPHGAAYFKAFYKTGRSPDASVTILIEDLRGEPPFNSGISDADLAKVRAWAFEHLDILRLNWKLCLQGKAPTRIEGGLETFFKGLWVKDFKYLQDLEIEIEFSNGEVRLVDFSRILEGASGQVGEILTRGLFRQAVLEDGTLLWPNGIDFDPDGLYDVSEPLESKQVASKS